MTKEKEKERLETCDNQPGEWVAMETKVVKGFKEKVINTVKCSREFQKDKDRPPPPPPPLDKRGPKSGNTAVCEAGVGPHHRAYLLQP